MTRAGLRCRKSKTRLGLLTPGKPRGTKGPGSVPKQRNLWRVGFSHVRKTFRWLSEIRETHFTLGPGSRVKLLTGVYQLTSAGGPRPRQSLKLSHVRRQGQRRALPDSQQGQSDRTPSLLVISLNPRLPVGACLQAVVGCPSSRLNKAHVLSIWESKIQSGA